MSTTPMRPETRYAKSPDGYVAYQVFGSGPRDLLFMTHWVTNVDAMWEEPSLVAYMQRLASFSRVITYDKRGSGVSDPVPLAALPTIERWVTMRLPSWMPSASITPPSSATRKAGRWRRCWPPHTPSVSRRSCSSTASRAGDGPTTIRSGMPGATVEKLLERYEHHWGVTSEVLDQTAPSVAST